MSLEPQTPQPFRTRTPRKFLFSTLRYSISVSHFSLFAPIVSILYLISYLDSDSRVLGFEFLVLLLELSVLLLLCF